MPPLTRISSRFADAVAIAAYLFVLAAAVPSHAGGTDTDADDTRALVECLRAPALVVPGDVTLPAAPHPPPVGSIPVWSWEGDGHGFGEVALRPWVSLPRWDGRSSTVSFPQPPQAPVLVLTRRAIRFPAADFSVELPRTAAAGALDDAMTRLRFVLAWAREEVRALLPPEDHDERHTQPDLISRLVIMADRDTPFATLASAMDTIGEAGWDQVTFAVSHAGVLGGFQTYAPTEAWKESYARACEPTYDMVRMDPEGFRITVFGNPVAPGCGGEGPGVTVPNASGGARDYAGLRHCLRKLQDAYLFEGAATISAAPETDDQSIMDLVGAIRKNADGSDLVTGFELSAVEMRWVLRQWTDRHAHGVVGVTYDRYLRAHSEGPEWTPWARRYLSPHVSVALLGTASGIYSDNDAPPPAPRP